MVDLPFVPVTAMIGKSQNQDAASSSLYIGIFCFTASFIIGISGEIPGLIIMISESRIFSGECLPNSYLIFFVSSSESVFRFSSLSSISDKNTSAPLL